MRRMDKDTHLRGHAVRPRTVMRTEVSQQDLAGGPHVLASIERRSTRRGEDHTCRACVIPLLRERHRLGAHEPSWRKSDTGLALSIAGTWTWAIGWAHV